MVMLVINKLSRQSWTLYGDSMISASGRKDDKEWDDTGRMFREDSFVLVSSPLVSPLPPPLVDARAPGL